MADHDDLITRLHRLGAEPIDSAQQSSDLTAMAGVRPPSRLRPKLRLAGAFLAGLLIGSTGLAAADVLPDPAQHVAHNVLDRVGIDVPDPERYHGPECGDEAKRNHGAYVRDDHDLAKSDCGKSVKAADASNPDDDGPKPEKADKGPCQGKPSWAGNNDLSAEDKAAAQAARVAQCGADEGEADEPEAPEPAETELEESEAEEPETEEPGTEEPGTEAPGPGGETEVTTP